MPQIQHCDLSYKQTLTKNTDIVTAQQKYMLSQDAPDESQEP